MTAASASVFTAAPCGDVELNQELEGSSSRFTAKS